MAYVNICSIPSKNFVYLVEKESLFFRVGRVLLMKIKFTRRRNTVLVHRYVFLSNGTIFEKFSIVENTRLFFFCRVAAVNGTMCSAKGGYACFDGARFGSMKESILYVPAVPAFYRTRKHNNFRTFRSNLEIEFFSTCL